MPTITISDETFENIKDQLKEEELEDISSLEDLVGKNLFIRTVTYHLLGKVEKVVYGKVLQLSTASWVGNTDRFSDTIKKGSLEKEAEVEPLGEWFVNMDAVTDFGIWKHKLPTKQK